VTTALVYGGKQAPLLSFPPLGWFAVIYVATAVILVNMISSLYLQCAHVLCQIMIALEELATGQLEPFENLADITQLINQHLRAKVEQLSSFKIARPQGWSNFSTSVHARAICGHQRSLQPARNLRYLVADEKQYAVEPEMSI